MNHPEGVSPPTFLLDYSIKHLEVSRESWESGVQFTVQGVVLTDALV